MILLTAAKVDLNVAAIVLFHIESGFANVVSVFLVPMSRDPG